MCKEMSNANEGNRLKPVIDKTFKFKEASETSIYQKCLACRENHSRIVKDENEFVFRGWMSLQPWRVVEFSGLSRFGGQMAIKRRDLLRGWPR